MIDVSMFAAFICIALAVALYEMPPPGVSVLMSVPVTESRNPFAWRGTEYTRLAREAEADEDWLIADDDTPDEETFDDDTDAADEDSCCTAAAEEDGTGWLAALLEGD